MLAIDNITSKNKPHHSVHSVVNSTANDWHNITYVSPAARAACR